MPRPKRERKVFSLPLIKGFKPFGNQGEQTETLTLLFDEYEAINLADYKKLTQKQAAKRMNVSRPTFARIYEKARQIIAQAFVEGKAIVIEGGNVSFNDEVSENITGKKYQIEFGKGGFCICLKCEVRLTHETGVPCKKVDCPKCGRKMIRENSFDHYNLKE
jgi:predicted DNA-binding protein (UPF0251 family)